MWVSLAVGLPVLLVLMCLGGWLLLSKGGGALGGGDESQVKVAASRFAEAVDTQDQTKILALVCKEESDEITGDEDYDPDDTGPAPGVGKKPFEVTAVVVKGDVASAGFRRPDSNQTGTLYLRKESGMWKVCKPAEQQFKAGGSTAPR